MEPVPRLDPGESLARLQAAVLAHPLLARLAGDRPGRALTLVGGAVRDALLGAPLADFDLAAAPGVLERVAEAARETRFHPIVLDPERNTIRWVRKGHSAIDVTAWRAADLEGDLLARDFTINALAFGLDADHGLIDPSGGASDLRAGRLRCPSPGSMEDDPLRALRLLRFVARLDFSVDPGTRAAATAVAERLPTTAGERRLGELSRLMQGKAWSRALELGNELGLLVPALGASPAAGPEEIAALEAALAAWSGCFPAPLEDGSLRLLLLLASLPEAGCGLPLEKAWTRWLKAWHRQGPRFRERAGGGDEVFLPWLWDQGEAGQGALARALAEEAGGDLVQAARPCPRPGLPIDGGTVMRLLDLAPGPEVKRALDRVAVAVARGRVRDRDEAVAWLRDRAPGIG